MIACGHAKSDRHGKHRKGNQRYGCLDCGKTWVETKPRLLGPMRIPEGKAKLVLEESKPIIQISTDGFQAYPEAVDLAFDPYSKPGTIIKDYRNAKIIYTPSEIVGQSERP